MLDYVGLFRRVIKDLPAAHYEIVRVQDFKNLLFVY